MMIASFLIAMGMQVVGGEWTEFYWLHGSISYERYGAALAGGMDYDLDGSPDLLVGAPEGSSLGTPRFGIVEIRSPRTGALLETWSLGQTNGRFGAAVAWIEDLDNDGRPDLIVGAPTFNSGAIVDAGRVFAVSSFTGLALHELPGTSSSGRLGSAVAVLDDLNTDGFPEYAVGEPGVSTPSGVGRVHVVSGASGAILYTIDGNGAIGEAIGRCADVDLDGVDDLLIGAPSRHTSFGSGTGAVDVISGINGALIRTLQGRVPLGGFGESVCSVVDVDRDGSRDVLVGAPNGFGGSSNSLGGALVFSSRTGNLLRVHAGVGDYGRAGEYVTACGDLDADGSEDYAVIAPHTQLSMLQVFSGRTGARILEYVPLLLQVSDARCCGIGDVNGDGRSDLAVSHPDHDVFRNQTYNGQVSIFGIDPYLTSSPSLISAAAGAFVQLNVDFPDHAGGWEYRILLSAAGPGVTTLGVPVPLARDAMLARTWSGRYPSSIPMSGMTGTLDPVGLAQASASFAPGIATALIGRTVALAAVAIPPGMVLPQISTAFATWTIVP